MKEEFIAKGVGAGRRADTRPAPTRFVRGESAITLIALVITIVLNCSYLAMERIIYKEPNILKIQ